MSALLATLVEVLDNVIRGLTVGGAIGMFLGYHRQKTRPEVDPFRYVARWSIVGIGFALIIMLLSELL